MSNKFGYSTPQNIKDAFYESGSEKEYMDRLNEIFKGQSVSPFYIPPSLKGKKGGSESRKRVRKTKVKRQHRVRLTHKRNRIARKTHKKK